MPSDEEMQEWEGRPDMIFDRWLGLYDGPKSVEAAMRRAYPAILTDFMTAGGTGPTGNFAEYLARLDMSELYYNTSQDERGESPRRYEGRQRRMFF